MKQKHFFIGVFSFLLFSAFTTYTIVTGDYLVSSPADTSFGTRIVDHNDEMASLDNYFTNVSGNASVVEDHDVLMNDFEHVIVDQSEYMADNNISFEQIHETPSILPTNFRISDEQYFRAMNVINSTIPVASPDLQQSLYSLREYIDLARQVRYSVFEIYVDSSGDEGLLPPGEQHLSGQDMGNGLQSKEAIRKLRDLLKKDLLNITKEQFTIYPNPLSTSSTISFLNSLSGQAQFVLYDIKGRTISAVQKNLENGTAHIQANEVLDIGRLSKGIYILKINTASGNEMSNKLIIK